jgi:LPS-assembly protein
MHFKYLIILIFSTLLIANDDVEVLAKSVEKNGDVVHAKEDVVLYSQKYVITADEAFYNTQTGDIELLGNITMLEGAEFSSRSGHANINLKKDIGTMVPLFMYMSEDDMWMKCESGSFDAEYYFSKKAITSTCEVQDPDWKMGFTSGKYNKESKFMHLYNTLFYIQDVPVFYLPYFAFSTDRTRRSGLLRPDFGISGDEGFSYLQPIFIAPYKNWDIQLDPQIRTSRGYGLNTTLRFVDSLYSRGEVSFGQFNEYKEYAEENSLDRKHNGYAIYYDRSNLLSSESNEATEDGLLLDFQYISDVDYLSTLDFEDTTTSSIVTSKFNYYFKRDKDYFGLYAKYYIDTDSSDSQDEVTQEIPTMHYHKFLDTFLYDNIYYSVDYKNSNYTRDEGYTAFSNEVSVPVSINFRAFSDYLNFKITNTTSILRVDYGNQTSSDNLDENYGLFIQNSNLFSLSTDLAKSYEDFYHTMFLDLSYTKPSDNELRGYFVSSDDDDSIVSYSEDTENVTFKLVQFFYDSSGEKKASHTLSQIYYSDYEYKYGDLENTLKFYFSKNITMTNIFNYSHEYSKTSKIQTVLNWLVDDYTFGLTYTHENDEDTQTTNFLSMSISTNYMKNYNFFAGLDVNIEDDFFKSWKIGWKYDRKCWNYMITYKEDRTPTSGDTTNKRGIYLMFNLAQIGAINYDFTKESGVSE